MTKPWRVAPQLAIVTIVLACPLPNRAQTLHSPATIFRNARPSVVLIVGGNSSGKPTVQGSGFIVAPNRIATNHHVMAGVSTALAVFSDGTSSDITDVFADSPTKDLIVLVANTGHRPALHLGDELTLRQGDAVLAIGAPEGLELTLTNGIVSAFRNIDNQFLIQTTAVIGHGSSGGPLLDREGEVVGITSSLLSSTPGVYFSVGVGDLKRLLRTPEAVLVPLAEWGKQSADTEAEAPPEVATSSSPGVEDRVEKLIEDKKFDQARATLRVLNAKEPDSETVHRLTGELDEKVGNLEDAVGELGRAVQEKPTDPLAQFYYALCLFQEGRFAEALEHEQESDELAPSEPDKRFLAVLYYSVRDYKQAESMARHVLASDPRDEFALSVLAGVAYHGASSQQDTWRQYAQELSAIDPDTFWAHMLQGIDAYRRDEYGKAVTEFTTAEQYGFPDPAPYLILASWYDRSSELGRAEDQIRAGLKSIPNDPGLLNEGVYEALRTQDDTEAARRFEFLQRSYPDGLLTVAAGCLYYYGIGQPLKALPYCAQQTKMSPNDHTAHSNYGWAALDANQFSLALKEFAQAYKIVSPNLNQMNEYQAVDLLWGFAIAEYNLGHRNRTRKVVKTIRKSYPAAATVTGLQQMPLLWSPITMQRIESILTEFPK